MPDNRYLDVPGARLHYEVQGEGPLLMLAGHPMGTSGFAVLARLLAKDYTVVTYDPRGFFASTIEDPQQDAEPALLADDLRRVLAAAGGGPAYLFGSSGGAVCGLALVANHPTSVRALIAHEPPLALLLPEAERATATLREICATYSREGARSAWESFSAFTGMSLPAHNEAAPAGSSSTSERFFLHGVLPIATYKPDLAALRASAAPVVVACGATSQGEFAGRAARLLAERLEGALVEFPGGHTGFLSRPEDFASTLRHTLAGLRFTKPTRRACATD